MLFLFFLASLLQAETPAPDQTNITNPSRVDNIEQSLAGYTVGRSTFTGTPRFASGYQCTNTSGNCITFKDGSVLNSTSTIPSTTQYIIYIDSEAVNTAGPTCSNGTWSNVTINTLIADDTGLSSVSSPNVTMPPGAWTCEWCTLLNNTGGVAITRLWNTDSAVLIASSMSSVFNLATVNGASCGIGRFTIFSNTNIKLQLRCASTTQTPATNAGDHEVYTQLKCVK